MLESFLSGSDGKGVYGLQVLEPVPKGEVIGEYTGPLIFEESEENRLIIEELMRGPDVYLMDRGDGFLINGLLGSEMRFINSSCKPNANYVIWRYRGAPRVFVIANRDIEAFEMVYASYKWDKRTSEKVKCMCKQTQQCKQGKKYL
jgi:SET domain-containing protein